MLLTTLLATLPGLIICYAMFRADKYEREPLGPLVICFLGGAAATVPAIWASRWAFEWAGMPGGPQLTETFLLAFGVVAPWEEGVKLLILLLIFPRKFFNEPLDGIVYAVMVGMGFATMENIAYLQRFGSDTLFIRAFTAIPAHLIFAIVQGYFIGKAKFLPEAPGRKIMRNRLIIRGFLISFVLHGTYDWLIFQNHWQWLFMLATSTTYLCLFYASELIREHLDNSPFK